MKTGIVYEHQLPRPWPRESEYGLRQDRLALIERADRLGYDDAWEVEHHFLEDTGCAHDSEDIVRLTPAELERKMAAQEVAAARSAGEPR